MEVDLFVVLTQNYYTRPNMRENKIITILEGDNYFEWKAFLRPFSTICKSIVHDLGLQFVSKNNSLGSSVAELGGSFKVSCYLYFSILSLHVMVRYIFFSSCMSSYMKIWVTVSNLKSSLLKILVPIKYKHLASSLLFFWA